MPMRKSVQSEATEDLDFVATLLKRLSMASKRLNPYIFVTPDFEKNRGKTSNTIHSLFTTVIISLLYKILVCFSSKSQIFSLIVR